MKWQAHENWHVTKTEKDLECTYVQTLCICKISCYITCVMMLVEHAGYGYVTMDAEQWPSDWTLYNLPSLAHSLFM